MKILDFGRQAWKRPSDWIDVPYPQEDEIYALFFVDEYTKKVGFLVEGDFIVDWGDGNIVEYTSGSNVSHTYDFASLDAPLNNKGQKQVIIKIYPQVGNHITKFSAWNALDSLISVKLNLPYCNTITDAFRQHYNLQEVYVYNLPDNVDLSGFVKYLPRMSYIYINPNIKVGKYWETFSNGAYKTLKVDISNPYTIGYSFANTEMNELIIINKSNSPKIFSGGFLNVRCQNFKLVGNKIKLADNQPINNFFYNVKNPDFINAIDNLDTVKPSTLISSFNYCYPLYELELDLEYATDCTRMIYQCLNLKKLTLKNIPKIDLDIKYTALPREELIKLFNALPDASGDSTSPTLTITGCRGVVDLTDDDKAIATNKNWTLIT